MNKLFRIMAFFAFTICFLLPVVSHAQGKKFVGKWVVNKVMPTTTISHLTISKKGIGFEVSRTKYPNDKWSALFDAKNQQLNAILGGKKVYFTYDINTDHLFLFEKDSNKFLSELKKE